MSKIEVDAITQQSGSTLTVGGGACKTATVDATTVTIGRSGGTVSLAAGATQSGFGRTGTVDWNTTPKTATFTAVSGDGFFCNTTGGAFTCNLPAGAAGAIVSLADYAGTWQTNNLTVSPNGSEKIGSVNADVVLSTEGQSVTFVYVDGTQGWINVQDSTSNVRASQFVLATGGTITESGDFKIHTFTSPGTFTVTKQGSPSGSNTVSYMVVAGGGGGGWDRAGGGGAGGFRESKAATDTYTASPLNATSGPTYNLPVTAQGYPITVGAGGTGGSFPNPVSGKGLDGAASVFSTITSAGGGGGGAAPGGAGPGRSGGSGGGAAGPGSAGAGNTPPVSPAQGTDGGSVTGVVHAAGGGGATAVGGTGGSSNAGAGGAGATTSINGSPTTRAGGGGGGHSSAGNNPPSSGASGGSGGGGAGGNAGGGIGVAATINTGSGGGGGGNNPNTSPAGNGGNGGSGIVVIRYKFQ
jgi:hypothetical protein